MPNRKRIGIPRSLLYYRYGANWQELLTAAGWEVIVSPQTTDAIQHDGLNHSVADLCLPVKVFFGHVAALRETVDALFVPRYISVERRAFMCPKFIGLPDMVRAAIRNIPPVFDPVMHVKDQGVPAFLDELNRFLGVPNSDTAEQMRILEKPAKREHFFGEGTATVAITGRPYLVLDNHMNKGIIRYLNRLGIRAFYYIPDLYSVEKTMDALPKWVYWSLGKEVVTSVREMLGEREVDGIINLVNAGCGPDSFMVELINRAFEVEKKPYMTVTIDEHTSDVGLQTRLEAFVDMALRRKKAQ